MRMASGSMVLGSFAARRHFSLLLFFFLFRFGIAVRRKAMPLCNELPAQILVIVDLAIENDPDRAIFVGYRLVPARKIDDAEPAHADGALPIDVDALIVRTSMTDLSAHLPDDILSGRRASRDVSCDPTHNEKKGLTPISQWRPKNHFSPRIYTYHNPRFAIVRRCSTVFSITSFEASHRHNRGEIAQVHKAGKSRN